MAALPSNTNWDIRTTGATTNGGGYVSGSSGTDFSVQDAPNSSGVVGTATGTTSFQDISHAFTSFEVGNILQIASGSGFTPGFYQVVSVSGGVATLNTSPGTGTAAVWALGGGLTSLTTVFANLVSGNTVFLKAGTYTFTSTLSFPAVQKFAVEGYQSSHGDYGTRPLITTSTNSTVMFLYQSTTIKGATFRNISMSNTASTRAICVNVGLSGTVGQMLFYDCLIDGFSNAFVGDNNSSYYSTELKFIRTEVKNCTATNGAVFHVGCTYMYACWIHDNPNGSGFYTNTTPVGSLAGNSFVCCVFSGNGIDGIFSNTSSNNISLNASNCVFYNNTADGIHFGTNVVNFTAVNCIFDSNGGYGINMPGPSPTGCTFALDCAFYNNTSGAYSTYNDGSTSITFVGLGDISLSGHPFTAASSGDFSLNGTAGQGAACNAAGFPGVAPFGTGYISVGALDPNPSGGGGGGGMLVNPGMSGGIRG